MTATTTTAERVAVERPGDRPLRKDGDVILKGQADYVDDIAPAGVLYAAVLRSPHAHARIRAIDTACAEAMPGVRLVLTGEGAADLAGPVEHFFDPGAMGLNTGVFPVLAVDVVRWVGDPVAAVVAETLNDAEAALSAITVDYEVLPAVLDVEEALETDAPKVFDDWSDNALFRFPFKQGEASAEIAQAPHRIAGRVSMGRHGSTPMEPRGCVAEWHRTGRLTLWASTQMPHPLRTHLAVSLGLDEDRIRVVATRMGGGFGHKFVGYCEELLVCILSKLAGAPVKWVETRADALLVGAREHLHEFEVGFDDDGVVRGFKNRLMGNVGSLAGWGGWSMVFVAGLTFPGPYAIAHYEVEAIAVATNKAPWQGYRGFGKEQVALVMERVMDLIAEELDLDPAEVRRRNFIPPEAFPHWTASSRLDSGDYQAALDKVLEVADYRGLREWQQAQAAQGVAIGVGIGFELCPEGGDLLNSYLRVFDTSTVRVNPNGGVTVLTGVTSPGTGNETTIAYLVALEFGISPDRVTVVQGDTDRCPYGYGTFTSRAIATGGAAAVAAAREIRDQMTAAARILLERPDDEFAFVGGRVESREDPAIALDFAELADKVRKFFPGLPGFELEGGAILESTKSDQPHNFHHTPDELGRTSTYATFAFSAHIVVVRVDLETGVVAVEKYFSVDDVGVVINSNFVEGQVFGAVAQGIGGALWEDMPYDAAGQPLAYTWKQYLVPRATDLPTFVTSHQETPSPYTLLGTKGAGETGVSGSIAAVANAVNDAIRPCGARAHDLPLNPPRVLAAILEAGQR